ncbi:MAG: hypothetical protein ACP5G6_06900 [Conexivisphaera sp.]
MTLVIASVWGRSVLLVSDSRASMGPVAAEEHKLHPIYMGEGDEELDLGVAAGAGDAALVKQWFGIAEDALLGWAREVGAAERRNPRVEELKAIVDSVEARLMERYSKLRGLGIEVDAELVLGAVSAEGTPILYYFDPRGVAEPRHESPGYALLGRGMVTGGLVLLKLLGFTPEKAQGWDAGLLAAFLIDMVSEVDPSVSPFMGDSYLIRYDEDSRRVVMGPLKEEAYRDYKNRVRIRRKLMEELWSLADELGERRVERALARLGSRARGSTAHP